MHACSDCATLGMWKSENNLYGCSLLPLCGSDCEIPIIRLVADNFVHMRQLCLKSVPKSVPLGCTK